MEQMHRGDQIIYYDKQRTIEAYASLRMGACEECGCTYCRNFAAQRDKAYPDDFRLILGSLGIDFTKEGEVYECGPEDDLSLYGGWFYFAGQLIQAGERLTGASSGFQYYFVDAKRLPKPPASFGANVAAIEFYTKIPWVLSDPR